MVGTEVEQTALADSDLYNALIKHRQYYSRLSWVDYTTLAPETISFVPPKEVIEIYRKDYETMQQQMIYGEEQDFDKILENLNQLQEKLRRNKVS